MKNFFFTRKYKSWIGISMYFTIFLEFPNLLFLYYFDIFSKKKKNLGKILSRILFSLNLQLFNNWRKITLLKKKKKLCKCNRECYLFSKNFIFSKFKIFNLKFQEKIKEKHQLKKNVDSLNKLLFSSFSFSNLKFQNKSKNFFGIFLYSHTHFLSDYNKILWGIFDKLVKKIQMQLIFFGMISKNELVQEIFFFNNWDSIKNITTKKLKLNLKISRIFKIILNKFNF